MPGSFSLFLEDRVVTRVLLRPAPAQQRLQGTLFSFSLVHTVSRQFRTPVNTGCRRVMFAYGYRRYQRNFFLDKLKVCQDHSTVISWAEASVDLQFGEPSLTLFLPVHCL